MVMLGLPSLADRHIGEKIAKSAQSILEVFELCIGEIIYNSLDNSSNDNIAIKLPPPPV